MNASRTLLFAALAGMVFAAPVPAQPQELLYVGNNHAGTVSVISVPDFEVIAEFDAVPDRDDLQAWPTEAQVDDMVAPRSGEVLYLSRPRYRDIAAFSTATEEMLWRLPTPGKPDHFALDRDGSRLFVSIYNEQMVIAVDTATQTIVGSFPTVPTPHGIMVSPSGKYVFSGAITGDQLAIADAETLEVIRTVEFENGVRPFAITEDETTAFVQISKLHGFHVMDIGSGRVTKTIHLPNPDNIPAQKSYPHTAHHGIVLTPDNRYLCVAATMQSYVAILSVPELDLLATVPVGREPSWVITSLDGRYCYASARLSDTVSIIDIEAHKEIKRVPVGDYPQRMWTVAVPFRRGSR